MLYSLNEKIKELRALHGYSQVDFAKQLGVTKQCVSNWENDNVVPSVEMFLFNSQFLLWEQIVYRQNISEKYL